MFDWVFDLRQVDAEPRALTEFAACEDVASALLHNSVHRRQSEAGTFALFLGGEKRLEDSRLSFPIHSNAGIRYREHHIRSRLDQRMLAAAGIKILRTCLDKNLSTLGHRIFCIDHQVHDDLLELAGIGTSMAEVGRQPCSEFDGFANQGTQ